MQEEWRDIKGYEGYYQVSNLGKVRSVDRITKTNQGGVRFARGKEIKQRPTATSKYQYVDLHREGKVKHFSVHRLVAQAFVPNPDNLPQVNHINEDISDNRSENLEWCTQKYNNNYGNHSKKQQKARTSAKTCVVQMNDKKEILGIYCSQWEAARKTGTRQGGISSVLTGRTKTANGFYWRRGTEEEWNKLHERGMTID